MADSSYPLSVKRVPNRSARTWGWVMLLWAAVVLAGWTWFYAAVMNGAGMFGWLLGAAFGSPFWLLFAIWGYVLLHQSKDVLVDGR